LLRIPFLYFISQQFNDGLFSSDVAIKHRVNAHGLARMNEADFAHALQVTTSNPMAGLDGRFKVRR